MTARWDDPTAEERAPAAPAAITANVLPARVKDARRNAQDASGDATGRPGDSGAG